MPRWFASRSPQRCGPAWYQAWWFVVGDGDTRALLNDLVSATVMWHLRQVIVGERAREWVAMSPPFWCIIVLPAGAMLSVRATPPPSRNLATEPSSIQLVPRGRPTGRPVDRRAGSATIGLQQCQVVEHRASSSACACAGRPRRRDRRRVRPAPEGPNGSSGSTARATARWLDRSASASRRRARARAAPQLDARRPDARPWLEHQPATDVTLDRTISGSPARSRSRASRTPASPPRRQHPLQPPPPRIPPSAGRTRPRE